MEIRFKNLKFEHSITNLQNIAQLKTWSLLCDEPGFLSSTLLWRNGIEALPECQGAMERPAQVSDSTYPMLARNTIRIYPNPAAGWVTVGYPAVAQQQMMQVFDSQGRLVHKIDLPALSGKVRMPTARFTDGLYFICIHTGKCGLNYGRFIVAH